MANRTNEVKVGLFVVIAGVILIITLIVLGRPGGVGSQSHNFSTKLSFAGGVEPGTVVRFAGIKAGRVADVRIDPQDSSKVLLALELRSDVPVKADSVASVQTLGFLGDNYVEVSPGSKSAATLAPGDTIQSKDTVLMSELFERIDSISKNAEGLMDNLNQKIDLISTRADSLLSNVNTVFSESNKRELSGLLRNADTLTAHAGTLLDRTGPKLDKTLENVQAATEKIQPLLENFKGSLAKLDGLVTNADKLTTNIDGLVSENRPQIKQELEQLRSAMADAQTLIAQLSAALKDNRSDVDDIIANFARSSRNIEDLTNTLKQRPDSIVGFRKPKDRKVPGGK